MQRKKNVVARMNIKNIERPSISDTVGFVVRIHGGRHTSQEIKGYLRSLGLSKKYDGVFMNLDSATIGKEI